MSRLSRRQDEGDDPGITRRMQLFAAPGLAAWLPTRILVHEELSIDPPAGFGETFAKLLAAHSGPVTVELHGYASEAGDPTYNRNLSERRAYRTLVKLVIHGYLRLHDKEKEDFYTLS